jgi:hypothetical protein
VKSMSTGAKLCLLVVFLLIAGAVIYYFAKDEPATKTCSSFDADGCAAGKTVVPTKTCASADCTATECCVGVGETPGTQTGTCTCSNGTPSTTGCSGSPEKCGSCNDDYTLDTTDNTCTFTMHLGGTIEERSKSCGCSHGCPYWLTGTHGLTGICQACCQKEGAGGYRISGSTAYPDAMGKYMTTNRRCNGQAVYQNGDYIMKLAMHVNNNPCTAPGCPYWEIHKSGDKQCDADSDTLIIDTYTASSLTAAIPEADTAFNLPCRVRNVHGHMSGGEVLTATIIMGNFTGTPTGTTCSGFDADGCAAGKTVVPTKTCASADCTATECCVGVVETPGTQTGTCTCSNGTPSTTGCSGSPEKCGSCSAQHYTLDTTDNTCKRYMTLALIPGSSWDDTHGKLLVECAGNCEADADCDDSLVCHKRDALQSVPGCAPGGDGDQSGYNYCSRASP